MVNMSAEENRERAYEIYEGRDLAYLLQSLHKVRFQARWIDSRHNGAVVAEQFGLTKLARVVDDYIYDLEKALEKRIEELSKND